VGTCRPACRPLRDATGDELRQVQQAFDLHKLAVEDTLQGDMGVIWAVWDTHPIRCADSASLDGCPVPLPEALVGEVVGLREVGESLWQIQFGEYPLGVLDERRGKVIRPA
jgi:hypothetical protein